VPLKHRNIDFYRDLFRNLKILLFYSHYIPSLLLFMADNKSMYSLNSDNHNINSRRKFDFINIHKIYLYLKREFTLSTLKCFCVGFYIVEIPNLIADCWIVAPCSLVDSYQQFEGTSYPRLQGGMCSSEMLVLTYQASWCHNSEDHHMNLLHCENLRCQ
jgi:hypothetical protein